MQFARDFNGPIFNICTSEIEQWRDFQRYIKTLFNLARQRGYLPRDHETEAHWLAKLRLKSKPIQILKPQELRELLDASEGQARLAIIIWVFTGIRSAEMLRLRWEDFNWKRSLTLVPIKRRPRRVGERRRPHVSASIARRFCNGRLGEH